PRPFAEPPDVPALSPYAYPKAFSLVLALLRLALGLLRLAGGDQRATGRCHRARLVVNGQFALRPVEVNPHRVSQNRPAIGLAQHPGAQHAARVSVAPPESFRDRGRGVRQRTDLVSLGRKRLRPPGAKKLDLLARLRRAAFPVGFAHDLGILSRQPTNRFHHDRRGSAAAGAGGVIGAARASRWASSRLSSPSLRAR